MKKIWLLSVILLAVVGFIFFLMRKPTSLAKKPQDWIVVIPGITGDLAKRKLIPSLYHLYKRGEHSFIIGTGRRDADIQSILNEAKKFIHDADEKGWTEFVQRVSYKRLDPQNANDFKELEKALIELETKHAMPGKRLIYLSLPADVFCSMTRLMVENGVVKSGKDHIILYEKPLGWSLDSAKEIHVCLEALLPDRQIYYVDHYVAKTLTQKLPYLFQTNELLRGLWSGKYIESIAILFHEKIDIAGRGQFYDRYGVIKDVMQNHVLQLLAFFGSDLSPAMSSSEQSKRRADFLHSLSVKGVHKGQYAGYKKEKDVSPTSSTETFASVNLESSDPRWKGVHFFLEAGKAVGDKKTQLRVRFRPIKEDDSRIVPHELIIQFSPEESILLRESLQGEPKKLLETGIAREAYENIFEDVFTGQFKYSVGYKEILEQWRLADAMLAFKSPVKTHPKGLMPEKEFHAQHAL